MSFWVAGAMVGSALIGAYTSNKASKKAAKGNQKAIDAQNELIGPYSAAGAAGLAPLQEFVSHEQRFSETQAYKDITNSAKAGGQNQSGNRMTALTDYYATNFRPQRLNELSFLPTLGANAAVGQATSVGNFSQAQGDARAAGALGVGNSVLSGINQLGFLGLSQQGNTASNTAGFGVGNYGNYGTQPTAPFQMPGRT
jgi:hypothetical protein